MASIPSSFGQTDQVLAEEKYSTRIFTLNRPKQLNAVSFPMVSILNGIVMGGGVGVSIHGRFRVATENSLFAMPGTALGLFPDVGASYFLSRLPGFFVSFYCHYIYKLNIIDKCFSQRTIEEIILALEREAADKEDEWISSTLQSLKKASPTSLKISLRSGCRAILLDKDKNPKWEPAKLEQVAEDMVE